MRGGRAHRRTHRAREPASEVHLNTVLIILVAAVWLYGLWWALKAFGPLGKHDAEPTEAEIENVDGSESRAWPLLFLLAHALVLGGVLMRITLSVSAFGSFALGVLSIGEGILICLLMKCETDTVAEPRLIDLSIQHRLTTQPEYERVFLWRRAAWLYEKPLLALAAAVVAIVGYVNATLSGNIEHHFVTAFGANLLLSLWVTFRYTTLAVRPSRVTLHRWLSFTPIREVKMPAIADVRVRRTGLQRTLGVGRIRLTTTHGRGLSAVIPRPEQFADLIQKFRDLLPPTASR